MLHEKNPCTLLSLFLLLLSFTPSVSLFPEPEMLDLTWTDSGDARWTKLDEKMALVDLWRSSGGVHWATSWDLRQDPCVNGWHGVLCDEFAARRLVPRGADARVRGIVFLPSGSRVGFVPGSYRHVRGRRAV